MPHSLRRLAFAVLALTGCVGGEPAPATLELPPSFARVRRLTHVQWENTVQDLFGLAGPTGLSAAFRDDPRTAGFVFGSDTASLGVDHALWVGYRTAAEEVARIVTETPAVRARLLPGAGEDEERIDRFVREFGMRAYRRPLADDEAAELAAVFSVGRTLHPEVGDDFVAGVRHVVEVVLQSPDFVYRIERSSDRAADVVSLDDWELAQRLSYLLWNSMPDSELFQAAAEGRMSERAEVERQARRLLASPRAADVVRDFHDRLLDTDRLRDISPSPVAYPYVTDELSSSARTERHYFVREVVYANDGGLADLLTSTETFVDAELATVYGLDGEFGRDFVRVDLDPAQRRGIFTQVGFLAALATAVDPDPIRRGAFVARRFACLDVSAPPAPVPPVPVPDDAATNRDRVEVHTEQPGSLCATCHTDLINPFGFALESYDGVGAFRRTDNDRPVDTSALVRLGDEIVPIDGGPDLAAAMADSRAVHECYVRHWIEYAAGQRVGESSAALVSRLAAASLDRESIRSLLLELVTSPTFRARTADAR